MIRRKPADADDYDWEVFETLCEEEGVGEYEEDWLPWWTFFESGLNAREDKRNLR